MIRVFMGSQNHTSRTVSRPISSGLGPSLLLAVAVMVLASGGVSSARVIGSAGAGLAMTVISDRAPKLAEPRQRGPDTSDCVEIGDGFVTFESEARVADAHRMVRSGELDLPPPAFVLS